MSHASVVHALPSRHGAAAELQQLEIGAWRQRWVPRLHVSKVHTFVSAHSASVVQQSGFDWK